MSKLILHKCIVQGHDQSFQDQVCMDTQCANRGLICERCAQSSHNNHYKIPLANFVDQYKESQGLSNIEQQMDIDSKSLQSMQVEIRNYLLSFMKTMQDEITKTIERLQTQFDSDVQSIASMKAAEQRYSRILQDIERKNMPNGQEASRKVFELISRVQLQPNRRFQLFNVSEEGFQKIKTTLRNTMSAKENIYNETTKIANDTQRYLDGLYRFLSSTLQKGGNPNYNQPLHGATFGQFSSNQNVHHSNQYQNEPDKYHSSDLNPPTAIFSPPNSSNQNRGFSNNKNNNHIYNSNNRNVDDIHSNGTLNLNNNSGYNNFSPQDRQNYHGFQNQPLQQSNQQVHRSYNSKPIEQLDNSLKQLHEFERNNENIFFQQQQQRGNNRSPSPFREEIHISNSPARSIAPNRSKTSNYFGNQDHNVPAGYGHGSQGIQDSPFDRSYSLTNNIGKANTQSMNTAHNQYFGDQGSMYNVRSNNNLDNTQLSNRAQYAAVNSNRVWWKSHDGPVRDIVFIDNDKIASASDDFTIKIWDKVEGKLLTTLTGHTKNVNCLAYHHSGRILASGSSDKTVKIWRPVPTWQCVHTFKGHSDVVKALSFLNESTLFSGGMDSSVKAWDIEKGIFIRSLEHDSLQKIHSMLMLQNKCLLVGYDRQICAWDLRSNQIMKRVDAHNSPVVRLLFVKGRRNDQPLIISAGKDSSVKIWEASTLIFLRSFDETYPINDIAYLSDIDSVAVSMTGQKQDGRIGVWNLNNMRKVKDILENNSTAHRLIYDDNYRLLYSSHENRLVEYNRLQL